MRSRRTAAFWQLFGRLPPEIRQQAVLKYKLWRENPAHPSLRFKQVHAARPIFSVRISRDYRALGVRDQADSIVWFWIGSHTDYDRLLRRA